MEQRLSALAGWRRAFAILLVQIAMAVVRAGELSFDEEVAHLRLNLERIPGCNNNVCQFAGLERSDLIGESEDLSSIQHDSFQSFIMRQAITHCCSRILREPARERRAKTRKRKRNSRRV